ncbi:MAG: ATP-binding protein [Gaiellales bacterium]
MLVGRDDERRSIDELLEATRSGKGGALALHGEPGIGKSSLLAYAAGRCQGLTLVEV